MSSDNGGVDAEATVEERELTHFSQADEFRRILLSDDFFPGGLQKLGLGAGSLEAEDKAASSDAKGEESMRRLTAILDEYQEQSYLLDPHLESIVVPAVQALQELVRQSSSVDAGAKRLGESPHVQRLARLLYCYTKVRGYKTIIHFYPHAVEDLLPTLCALEQCQGRGAGTGAASSWEMRYILLLWLSLICMIPFDLVRFDEGTTGTSKDEHVSTASRIQSVGRHFLASPGKERDAAAVVLGKLLQRQDTSQKDLQDFLAWSRATLLASPEPSIFVATGILQTLCGIVKTLSPLALAPHAPTIRLIVALYSSDLEEVAEAAANETISAPFRFSDNSLVNKYKAKMACRLGLKALRPRKRRQLPAARVLGQSAQQAGLEGGDEDDENDEEVPEQVDACIATLMDSLQDKDTVVRYSAAKGLSRLCGRLPTSFVDQVADAVMNLFSVNIADILGKKQDLSNVSEFTWQGCCLALAELARRGLLAGEALSAKLEWVEKALLFDIRRGAHSVGTGVRDAACYVLWAIARAHDPESIRPMARRLSHHLVCVALLDRDISIRRAASAAFQECVGRLSLFEHGIDIIRKTDFYAVGVRRNAFLECAPLVAVHASYREAIVDHLLDTTIVHWDPSMRQLGSCAIAKIAAADLATLAPPIIERMSQRCSSRDPALLHGALCTLAELADFCARSEEADVRGWCTTMFATLDVVPRHAIRPLGPAMVVLASCRLIATSATEYGLRAAAADAPLWNDFIAAALSRQDEDVQISASDALAAISRLTDCSSRIEATMSEWKSLSVSQQQGNTRALGAYDYQRFPASINKTLAFLLSLVEPTSPIRSPNVETRRNAFASLAEAIISLQDKVDQVLDGPSVTRVFTTMLDGLDDYTTDARGDVGSWIRMACLVGIRKLIDFLCSASNHPMLSWLNQGTFDAICAGYCRQMVERIDAVRSQAAIACLAIAESTKAGRLQGLVFAGSSMVDRYFARESGVAVRDPIWLLTRVVQLLLVPEYRSEVLKGVVLCMGGQKEVSNRIVSQSLSVFLLDQESGSYGPVAFVDDVVGLASRNVRLNRYFVPAIQTLNVLFEEGVMEGIIKEEAGRASLLKGLDLACRSATSIKSVARVMASMQYTIYTLAVGSIRPDVLARLPAFLLHPFPIVRSSAAESLYSSVQDHLNVDEEVEDILLSTRWSQTDAQVLRPTVDQLIALLSSAT